MSNKANVRRVAAGKLTFADLATDDVVYAIGLTPFYQNIETFTNVYGTHEKGKLLRKNARNSLMGRLTQEDNVSCRSFRNWVDSKSPDELYKYLCATEDIGHTSAVLFTIALSGDVPSLKVIVAHAIFESIFEKPATDALARIRYNYFGETDTQISSARVVDCAEEMYDAYIPTLGLKNPPTCKDVLEVALSDDCVWMSEDERTCMSRKLYSTESTLVKLVTEKLPQVEFVKAPSRASADQAEAFEGILKSNKCVVLEGMPGAGKSEVIKYLYNTYGVGRVLITSYTNKACAVLNQRIADYELGKKIGVRSILSTYYTALNNKKYADALRCVELLIVDESSFLSSLSLWHVLELLNRCAENCRLLLVGDPNQLPPVQEYGKPFVNLILFKDVLGAQVYKLTQFHRSDAEAIYRAFIELKHAGVHPIHAVSEQVEIVQAKTKDFAVAKVCDAYIYDMTVDDSVFAIAETNALCADVNLAIAKKLYGEKLNYKRGGEEAKHVVCDMVGMRVVSMANVRDKHGQIKLAKNEFAKIDNVTDEYIKLKRRINNEVIWFTREEADEYLQLGWCSTVYKAQGSEENIVYYLFDSDANAAGNSFSCMKEQKYVGHSRARKLLRIVAINSEIDTPYSASKVINVRTVDSETTKMYLNTANSNED